MKFTKYYLVLLLVAFSTSLKSMNVALIGSNNNANIVTYLTNNGFTVTDFAATIPSAATLATYQAVVLLRTDGNNDLKNWVNNGGLLITEWSGAAWAAGNVITATVSTSGSIGTGTLITFSGSTLGAKLNEGLSNPYSDGGASEFFYTFSTIGSGVETLATRPTNIPAIIGAAYGSGYTFVIAYDWADSFPSTSSNSAILLKNALNSGATGYIPVPPNPTSITANPSEICLGNNTQLTANGAQGTVYWYTGSCGGTQLTTGNPITVSPTVTTTYYARNYDNSQFSAGCASVTITVEEAIPAGNISITSDGSTTPGDWILCEGRIVPLQNNPSVNVSVIHDYVLNHGDLVVEAAADLTFDASLIPELPAGRTITFKAGNSIIFNEGATIAPTANALNVLIWPDSDAINGGRVSLNANASINTNNGHLWVGGGSGTTTWNGLNVGDGYAVSADGDVYPAISMENINISTGTGHQLYRGNQIHSIKSYKAIYIGDGSTIYSTTGAISFDGLSNSSHAICFNGTSIGWDRVTGSSGIITSGNISFQANKTEESNNAYPTIDSRDPNSELRNNYIVSTGNISFSGKNNGEHFIRLYGDDRIGWNGTDEGDAYVAANISITSEYGGALLQHLPTNYTNKKSRIYTKYSGTFSFTNQAAGSFTLSHPDGFIKAGNIEINCIADVNVGNWTANNDISITAGGTIIGNHDPDASSNTLKSTNSGTVTIKSDAITLGSENRIESGGELHIKPFTNDATIGIAGASGTLQLPASYFTTNIRAGFSLITIGSGDQSGNINLNEIEFRDNMRLQTTGKVVVNGNQTITLPNGMRLQVDNEMEMKTNATIIVQGQ